MLRWGGSCNWRRHAHRRWWGRCSSTCRRTRRVSPLALRRRSSRRVSGWRGLLVALLWHRWRCGGRRCNRCALRCGPLSSPGGRRWLTTLWRLCRWSLGRLVACRRTGRRSLGRIPCSRYRLWRRRLRRSRRPRRRSCRRLVALLWRRPSLRRGVVGLLWRIGRRSCHRWCSLSWNCVEELLLASVGDDESVLQLELQDDPLHLVPVEIDAVVVGEKGLGRFAWIRLNRVVHVRHVANRDEADLVQLLAPLSEWNPLVGLPFIVLSQNWHLRSLLLGAPVLGSELLLLPSRHQSRSGSSTSPSRPAPVLLGRGGTCSR